MLDELLKEVVHLKDNPFKKMPNLKFLIIKNVIIGDFKYLPNDLRVLDWFGCRLEALPSSFQPDKLVELIMPHSHIKYLWKGIKVRFSVMSKHAFLIYIYVYQNFIFFIRFFITGFRGFKMHQS